MNSVMMDYYYRYNFPSWGDPWNGGRIQFRKDRMISLPIFPATNSQKAEITDYVKEIIAAKKHDTKADVSGLEHQINELVYKLYELTPEEIAVVEGKH